MMRSAPLLLLTVLAAAVSSQPCDPHRYCPSTCTRAGAGESDGLTLLLAHAELVGSVSKAVDVMRRFPGVLTDDRLVPHTTFQYLCCLTAAELSSRAFPAMDAVRWAPFNVTYDRVVCNVDGSIILLADAPSQAVMGAVVARLEAAIEAAGLPVVPRSTMQSFHITIGTTNSSYPMQEALAAINAAIAPGSWSPPITLDSFAFLLPVPHEVRATAPAP